MEDVPGRALTVYNTAFSSSFELQPKRNGRVCVQAGFLVVKKPVNGSVATGAEQVVSRTSGIIKNHETKKIDKLDKNESEKKGFTAGSKNSTVLPDW